MSSAHVTLHIEVTLLAARRVRCTPRAWPRRRRRGILGENLGWFSRRLFKGVA